MHFLEKLALKILKNTQEDLQNLYVILPNIRAKLFLSNYLKKYAEKAIFLPISVSSSELMENISGIKAADDYLLLSKLFNAYPTDTTGDLSFDQFMNWGSSILQDFKELDHQLVNTEILFRDLQDIQRIEFWNVEGGQLSDYQNKYLNFCNQLNFIYNDFTKNMSDEGLGHSGYIERMAVEKLNEGIFHKNSKVIIAGFNALTKAEESIFDYFFKNYQTEFFWDYDQYYLDNPIHEAGHFARINRKKFSKTINWIFDNYKEVTKDITVYKCSTNYEQSFVVSEILKQVDGKENFMNTAVILPDESLLIPVLQSLPGSIKDINITMGYPLPHSPFYSLFEAFIKLFINIKNKGLKSAMFYFKDVHRLLDNDGIKQLSPDIYAKNIDPYLKEIVKNKQVFIPINQLNEILNSVFIHQKLDISANINAIELMNVFKNVIFNLDKILMDKDALIHKIEREFLLHHFEVVSQVNDLLDELSDNIDIPSLHRIWRHYSKLTKVQFTGEPLQGLQIMGLLESRNLDFEHVIILNTNEGTLPSDKSYGSMIPNDLKRKNGMHLHSDKDAVIAYHFYRLLQRAKKVDLLYSSQTDHLGSGEKSRYIIQLEKELDKSNSNHTITYKTAVSSIGIASSEMIEIEKSPYIVELIKQKFKSGLSPTSINSYINCPLNFYYTELVGLKENVQIIESLEADVLGKAIHKTMEKLYQPYLNKVLSIKNIEAMEKEVGGLLQSCFYEFIDEAFLTKGKNLLSYKMAEKMILRFLEKEKIYVQENKIEIIAMEIRLEKNIEIEYLNESVPIKIKGYVDRVEKRNGVLHLIDYKSGVVKGKELNIADSSEIFNTKDKALQLLTYSWLMDSDDRFNSENFSTSIYSFKSYNEGYMALQMDNSSLLNKDFLKIYEELLLSFVRKMLEDKSPLKHIEESKYCDFC